MKALAAALAVTAVALAGCGKPAPSRDLLFNRNWMSSMPKSQTDKLQVYRFVPEFKHSGVFQDRTLYKGTFELFNYKVTGDTIRFELHETHNQVTSPFKIENVDGPKPFDLRLTITNDPRGIGQYYGIRAETDRTGAALDARLAGM